MPRHRRSSRTAVRRILVASLSVALLASCGIVSTPDEAYSVNGSGRSRESLDSVLSDLAEAGDVALTNGATGDEIVRSIMRQLIRVDSFHQFVEARGLEITSTDRQQIVDLASGDAQFLAYTKQLQAILIELNVIEPVLSRMAAPTERELKAAYNESPASTGVLCLSHILVATKEEADAVLSRLAEGGDFAALAREVSTEPAAAETGGALADANGEACQALTAMQQGFDADFVLGALEGRPGVAYGPVRTQFGWHVILNRPFEEVGDSLARVVATSPGLLAFEGFLAVSDISVASRYGRWVAGLSYVA